MPGAPRESIVAEASHDDPSPRRVRYGLQLFAIYLVLYGGFVLLSAFAPSVLERDFLAGVNVAIGYGIGLIVAALVLALLYVWLCRESARDRGKPS